MEKKEKVISKGLPASKGKAKGKVFIIKNPIKVPSSLPKEDYILVAEYTTPVLNLAITQAKGVVCSTGGITMHAAVICRELGIPCIVGAKDIFQKVKSNQLIKINGTTGKIYAIKS